MAIATYKGFSTINNDFGSPKLTDTDLIKRDLLNHFAIRKGEKLSVRFDRPDNAAI